MKSLLFAALLILQLHAQACTFEDYIVRYNRIYSSEEERAARLEIFNQRMEQIEKSNSEGHSYVLGCTKWTDRFTSEMQGKLKFTQKHFPKTRSVRLLILRLRLEHRMIS